MLATARDQPVFPARFQPRSRDRFRHLCRRRAGQHAFHAHGQGYTDLNFLIPELVDRVSFRKAVFRRGRRFLIGRRGAYRLFPQPGCFVGPIDAGRNGYARSLLAGSPELAGGKLLYGLELFHNDGPWESMSITAS